jgi:hypothetical protein
MLKTESRNLVSQTDSWALWACNRWYFRHQQQVSGKIAKLARSQLQIDPGLEAGGGQDPGARVAIQQRVSNNCREDSVVSPGSGRLELSFESVTVMLAKKLWRFLPKIGLGSAEDCPGDWL